MEWDELGLRYDSKYRMFQKELYNGIANVAVWRVLRKRFTLKAVRTIHRSRMLNDD
jgi:hypothetical protein